MLVHHGCNFHYLCSDLVDVFVLLTVKIMFADLDNLPDRVSGPAV